MKFIKTIWATQLSELATWSWNQIQSMEQRRGHQCQMTELENALNVTLTPQLVSVLLYTENSLSNGPEKYKRS